jgi:uncharacterized protein YjdB
VTEGDTKVVVRIMNLVDTSHVTVKRLPAEVDLDVDTLLFLELGATRAVVASVVDGAGETLPADEILWKSGNEAVATVSASGTIQSVGQGLTSVSATAGSLVASIRVRVAVGPATVDVTPSELAFTFVGETAQLSAVVADAAGNQLDAIAVSYQAQDPTVATVTAQGLVTAQKLGTTSIVVRGDTARAEVPVVVLQTPAGVVVTPDGVKAVIGGTVSYSAAVTDANDTPIENPPITWSTTDAGIASVDTVGTATAISLGTVGIVALSGAVADTAYLEVLDPVVDSIASEPDSVEVIISQSAQLTADLFDAAGDLIVGATPTWSSDNEAVASVDSDGLVTGVAVGTTWIRATEDAGEDSTFVDVTAGDGAFDIQVRYVGSAPDAATQAAFAAAEARWEQLLLGDLQDGTVTVAAGACGIPHPAVDGPVDDLLIYAEITPLDGEGGLLGQAGPCVIRTESGLAIMGIMQFDEADMAPLAAEGLLNATIIHEMGHVLGFGVGSPWSTTLVGAGTADPYWPGAAAVAQYQANGGAAANAVPVANTGGQGTADAHWREAHMGRELMTGYINTGLNPLSSSSVAAMEDMGYTVNVAAAYPYTVSAALRGASGRTIQLNDAVIRPILALDPSGRIRVIGNR